MNDTKQNPSDFWAKRNAAAAAQHGVTPDDVKAAESAIAAAAELSSRRNAHAVETLRAFTEDHAPEESDFGAVAKVLNANRFAPPSGKRWTAKQVKAAFVAYCAAFDAAAAEKK